MREPLSAHSMARLGAAADARCRSSGCRRDLFGRAGMADERLEIYPGDDHDLLHEPNRAEVIADIGEWLVGHAAAE